MGVAMFRDCDSSELAVGDDVTVMRSSRHTSVDRSHGTIEKFGTKLVHVRLTRARTDLYDGQLLGFEPNELRKGHHGRPRHPGGPTAEIQEHVTAYRNAAFDRLVKKAVERGVITDAQGEAIKPLYGEVDA